MVGCYEGSVLADLRSLKESDDLFWVICFSKKLRRYLSRAGS